MGNDLYGFSPGCDPTEIAKATMTGLFRELQGIHFGKERLNKMDKRDSSFLAGSIGAAPTEHILYVHSGCQAALGTRPRRACCYLNAQILFIQSHKKNSSSHPGTLSQDESRKARIGVPRWFQTSKSSQGHFHMQMIMKCS